MSLRDRIARLERQVPGPPERMHLTVELVETDGSVGGIEEHEWEIRPWRQNATETDKNPKD